MADPDNPDAPQPSEEPAALNRQQEQLRLEHRLYRELFEKSLGLMCIHDLDGILLSVNPAAARSLGFRPQDGVGASMKRFLAPQFRHLYDEYLDRIRRNGSDSGLMRLRARDGSERIWSYRNVLYREPGSAACVLGHAQDITAHVQAEEALKESERRFRTMADTAPVMIWVSDTVGQCEFVNQFWLDYSGRSLKQELGDGWAEIFHPEDRERCVQAYLGAIAQRESFRIECRMRRADGQYRWMLESGAPRFDDHGRFAGYVGSCVDVTEARQHQAALRMARDELAARVAERTAELLRSNEALRESERHYQVLAELSPVGIVRADQHGTCLYVNSRACEILGISEEQLREGPCDRAIHPDDRDRVVAEWRRVLETASGGALEHRFQRPDGVTIWTLVHLAAERGRTGEITGVIATIADISERKREEEERRRLESQVQQAQRLQSLGMLAGGLAHDFNNLLTIILGNARLGLMSLPPGSKAIDSLAEIEAAASRAAELTGQMLAYAGRARLILRPVNLSNMTAEVVQLVQSIASKKTVFECDLPPGVPAIEADPAQIHQVLMNLITNAAEAIGEEGGIVKLSAGCMQADRAYLRGAGYEEAPAGRYVFLEVSDTGCGMDAETLSRVFDPFFTTKFTGRGLGLAAVLGIVRAHHGVLRVSSQPGAGSTFRLLLPCPEREEEIRPEAPVESDQTVQHRTILVVDDESGLRHLASMILEKAGFSVLAAENGKDAIHTLRQHAEEISAIVLDLTMPVMSGEEALPELQSIKPGVPVILCSGYGEPLMDGRFAGRGVAGFLKKPYHPAGLVEALRKALDAPG